MSWHSGSTIRQSTRNTHTQTELNKDQKRIQIYKNRYNTVKFSGGKTQKRKKKWGRLLISHDPLSCWAWKEKKKDYTRACIMKSSAIRRGLNCLQQLEEKKRAATRSLCSHVGPRTAGIWRHIPVFLNLFFFLKKKEILNSRDMKRMSNKNLPPPYNYAHDGSVHT